MTQDSIQVSVQAFAMAADAMGCREKAIMIQGPATVGDAWEVLLAAHPGLAALETTLAFACNDRLVDPGTPLVDGDTLALLPPVSGG